MIQKVECSADIHGLFSSLIFRWSTDWNAQATWRAWPTFPAPRGICSRARPAAVPANTTPWHGNWPRTPSNLTGNNTLTCTAIELRSCVKAEVAVLGSPSLIVRRVSACGLLQQQCTRTWQIAELRSCVKVEVAVLSSPVPNSPIKRTLSIMTKQSMGISGISPFFKLQNNT